MSSTLLEQLQKAGLVDEKKARKAEQQKQAQQRQGRAGGKKAKAKKKHVPSAAQLAAQAKQQKDRELNSEKEQAARKKALRAEIKQLIAENRIPREDGEHKLMFSQFNRVKQVYLKAEQRQQVIDGKLVLVFHKSRYDLVSPTIAEKIEQRDAQAIALWNKPDSKAEDSKAPQEDPYAGYEVPDDLMW